MGSKARENTVPKTHFDSGIWLRATNPAVGIAESVAIGLQCDEVIVSIDHDLGLGVTLHYSLNRGIIENRTQEPLFQVGERCLLYKGTTLGVPLVVNDLSRARLPGNLAARLSALGAKSFGIFKIERSGRLAGYVACLFKRTFHRWRSDEIAAFERISDALPKQPLDLDRHTAQSQANYSNSSDGASSVGDYQRLAEHGNIVILTTDYQFAITDVFGNSEALVGIPPDKIIGDASIWERIVDPRDAQSLRRRLRKLRIERNELKEEIRISHQQTQEARWLLLRALPQFSPKGEFLGWEGFGVDVTERREAQDGLVRQNERLEALFEISRALDGFHDPEILTLTGLKALIRATQSDSGYACFRDKNSGSLEVVAAIGLSEAYLEKMRPVLTERSLLRESVDSQARFLIDNIQEHPKASQSLAKLEGVRGTIIVPMLVDGIVYGAVVIFKKESKSYHSDDLELVSAAATQITLSIRQAEVLAIQKRQSDSLASLYKVSRELAKFRSTVNFADEILPLMRQEFGLKRAWVGVTNEQANFIVGRAALGFELNVKAAEYQIEIRNRLSRLSEILLSNRPTVVSDQSDISDCFLEDLFGNVQYLVVVPMVAIGQIMGVLVVEPSSKGSFASSDRLQLLNSMASEMATAMMAGRFESKMAEALKMRMAGLLASGVAHNFNNFLQAIMGQVALIEIQSARNQPILEAARIITESAQKGAALVNQLLNFAAKGASRKSPIDLGKLVSDSREFYSSLLGGGCRLLIDEQSKSGTTVLADISHIQQVLTNVVVNAKDALNGRIGGEVEISLHTVLIRAGELAPDISPGSYTRIDIRDNGCGMSQEEQARCFEPFFTTKNIDEYTGVGLSGSGLGLSAAYSMIKDHDGTITLHSKVGEGTIFSIYLPNYIAVRDLSGMGRSGDGIMPNTLGSGVLLLGLDPSVQPFVSSALESLGFMARSVYDVRQAGELIKREPSRWGAVIIDSDGLAAQAASICDQLANAYPQTYIVCLCSNNQSDIGKVNGNRIHHVEKPITVWGLEAAMKRIKPLIF